MQEISWRTPIVCVLVAAVTTTIGACNAHPGARAKERQYSGIKSPTLIERATLRHRSDSAQMAFHASPERLMSHIEFLAHDELEGRGTGSSGIDLAAGYIAGQFAAAGLEPGGPDGTYFQPFTVSQGGRLLGETKLIVNDQAIAAELNEDFRPFGFSAAGDFQGEVVFVGYGITNKDRDYDDYAKADVSGKVALMLRREPVSWDTIGYSKHASFAKKVSLAEEHGAVAVFVVNQNSDDGEPDSLMRFRLRDHVEDIPAIHVTRPLADSLLAAGGLESLDTLQGRLDAGENCSQRLSDTRIGGKVAYEANTMIARNVIGVLPGRGPRRNEYVVIGGHYDHLGMKRGRIYNGADDNASGTAGVIELAHAFSATRYRNRSIIFMAFTAEEIGLIGSKHFAKNPTVPVDSMKAMVNMDMIGRHDPDSENNKLSIQGLGTGLNFTELVQRHAGAAGIEFLPDDSALGPSDHDSFYRVGVPSLFFFTGVHEDYHRPDDDIEKVEAERTAAIITLIYNISRELVNGTTSPTFARVDRRARINRSAGRQSAVVMGIMPDMDDESTAKGWRIARVTPGGAAAKAGMKPGDRILTIDGKLIADFMDYRKATEKKKPGDIIAVSVLRGQKELSLSVELQAR